MFKFITHKPLWVNILAGVLLAFAILALVILSLNWFTDHDKTKTVPAVLNKPLAEAIKILEDAGFEVIVQDSVYNDTLKPSVITRQIPDELEVVKANRAVYLTVNRAVPPMVQMPNVVGYSLRSAEFALENVGLKLGDTTFRPDFAKNSVLEQLYNGVLIQPGAPVRMGSRISLVIGDGVGNSVTVVPNLIGLTFAQAKALLDSKGINLGALVATPDLKDTANAFVVRQSPNKFDEEGNLRTIRPGQLIDLWLSMTRPETTTEGDAPDSAGTKNDQD